MKKKLILQSVLYSAILHSAYFGGSMIFGYVQTRYYVPDIVNSYQGVAMLQNEVAFGVVGSPWLFFVSFGGVAVGCGAMIKVIQKYKTRLQNA